MNCVELFNSNFTTNLIEVINSIDLSVYSNSELRHLKETMTGVKKVADQKTLEDELVGYTYDNLVLLTPKINNEIVKRKIKI